MHESVERKSRRTLNLVSWVNTCMKVPDLVPTASKCPQTIWPLLRVLLPQQLHKRQGTRKTRNPTPTGRFTLPDSLRKRTNMPQTQSKRAGSLFHPSPSVSSAAGVEPEVGAQQRPAQRLGLKVHQAIPGVGEKLVHHRQNGGEEAA